MVSAGRAHPRFRCGGGMLGRALLAGLKQARHFFLFLISMQLKNYLQANPGRPGNWHTLAPQRQIAYIGSVACGQIEPLRGTVQVQKNTLADLSPDLQFFSTGNIICARHAHDFAHGVIGHIARTQMRYGLCAAEYFVLAPIGKAIQTRFLFHWLRYVVRREVAVFLLRLADDPATPSLPYVHNGMIQAEALLQHSFKFNSHLPPQFEQKQLSCTLDNRTRFVCKKHAARPDGQHAACAADIARIEDEVWQASTVYAALQSQLLHQQFFARTAHTLAGNLSPSLR